VQHEVMHRRPGTQLCARPMGPGSALHQRAKRRAAAAHPGHEE
jgi:hypothetical protein